MIENTEKSMDDAWNMIHNSLWISREWMEDRGSIWRDTCQELFQIDEIDQATDRIVLLSH